MLTPLCEGGSDAEKNRAKRPDLTFNRLIIRGGFEFFLYA
ncbi:hypothetical protein SAMN02746093_02752 [Legionella quinlivanii DSM 21216]|nr:hypothetical protein SAMN02746093_02752 [Legionella quinlivanii DSM 21216]STY10045.1 Uncharacterised protein [Legionella quinlivanii]